MKRAVLYLRVSTIDQTTTNQERELRQIAGLMGCQIVKVYKDHGISGAKGLLGTPQVAEGIRPRSVNRAFPGTPMSPKDEDFIRFYRDAVIAGHNEPAAETMRHFNLSRDYIVRLLNETIAGCEGQDIRNWKSGEQ